MSAVVAALVGAVVVEGALLVDARDRIAALESHAPSSSSSSPSSAPSPPSSSRVSRGDDDDRQARREERRRARGNGNGSGDDGDAFFGAPTTTPPTAKAPTTQAPASPEEAKVQEAVRSELRRIDDEREQSRDERRAQRVKDKVAEFAAAQQLPPATTTTLTNMLVAEQAELRQIFQDARENDSFDGVRDRVRELRKKTDDNASALLEDDAKAAFSDMREQEADRFRGGFFGGAGGGGR